MGNSGFMVALWVDSASASKLAVKGGEKPSMMHVTLVYLGKVADFSREQVHDVRDATERVARRFGPFSFDLASVKRFPGSPSSDFKDVAYVPLEGSDTDRLLHFRRELVRELRAVGVRDGSVHAEYRPHVTLAYIDEGRELPKLPNGAVHVDFPSVIIAAGDTHMVVPLTSRQSTDPGPSTASESEPAYKTENGVKFPASAYAYVPDPKQPSTWKVRLWETPDSKETARQVGMAAAALGEGFRGNKVDIPSDRLADVKARVRAAWRRVHSDDGEEVPQAIRASEEDAVYLFGEEIEEPTAGEFASIRAVVEGLFPDLVPSQAAEGETTRHDPSAAPADRVDPIISNFGAWAEGRFDKCVAQLDRKPGIHDPEKLCAWIKDRFEKTTRWRGKGDQGETSGEPKAAADPDQPDQPVGSDPSVPRDLLVLRELHDALRNRVSPREYEEARSEARRNLHEAGEDSAAGAFDTQEDLFSELGADSVTDLADLCGYDQVDGKPQSRGWQLFVDAGPAVSAAQQAGSVPEWIPYLPIPGRYRHPRYGAISITPERNRRFVQNFTKQVYQDQLPLDAEHQTKLSGAYAWITGLRQNRDGSVDARVRWTNRGQKVMQEGGFRYISPEWYDNWTDNDGTKHKDVVIGGALVTRPYFKHRALRSLVASEEGLSAVEQGTIAGEQDNGGEPGLTPLKREDSAVGTKDQGQQASEDQGQDQQAAGNQGQDQSATFTEQARRFAELEAENARLKQAHEMAQQDMRSLSERIEGMRVEARRKQFAEMVQGPEQGKPWFGEPERHISFLEKLADVFGDDAPEVKEYAEQQNAYAEQIYTSKLFAEQGSSLSGGGAVSTNPRAEAVAKGFREANPGMTPEQAMAKAYEAQPELYEEYLEDNPHQVYMGVSPLRNVVGGARRR